MASDPDQPNAQFSYQPEAETAFTYAPDAKPIEASDAETPEEDIDELVGEIKPWSEVEVSLDGWQYRVWDKWLNGDRDTAEILLDVIHQYDPTATLTEEHSKTHPESPDTVYVYRFSLYGSPDGVMDAITDIEAVFLELENYKVISGDASAIVKYPDGKEELVEVPTKGGTDIDDALDYVVQEFNKSLGSKGEQEEVFGRERKEGVTCSTCHHTFPTSEAYSRHLNEAGWCVMKTCPYCSFEYSAIEDINEHMKIEHPYYNTPSSTEGFFREEEDTWTPGYQAVPKALKGEPSMSVPEVQSPPDWGKIKKDVDTYGEEMAKLVETLVKIGDDPTGTPEAIGKSAKVAEDRIKDIVDWASDMTDKVNEQEELGGDTDYVTDGLQKILEHGSRLEMLLINTNEGAKQIEKSPLPEPEPIVEPELPVV